VHVQIYVCLCIRVFVSTYAQMERCVNACMVAYFTYVRMKVQRTRRHIHTDVCRERMEMNACIHILTKAVDGHIVAVRRKKMHAGLLCAQVAMLFQAPKTCCEFVFVCARERASEREDGLHA